MIPEGWQKIALGDAISRIEGGGTPSKVVPQFWNGSIPWASVKDVTSGCTTDTQDYISESGLSQSSARLVPPGTCILATRMAVGAVTRFSVAVAINQDLKALYPGPALSNEFLFFWLVCKRLEIEKLSSGTTVRGIRQDLLLQQELLLPPLYEQEKIVVMLRNISDSLGLGKAFVTQTRRLKQALLHQFLTKGIDENGRPHTRFKKTDIGEIPEAWEVVEVGTLISDMKYGTSAKCQSEKVESSVPVLRIPNVVSESIHLDDLKYRVCDDPAELERYKLEDNDLLFVRTNGNPDYVGRCALVKGLQGYQFASYLIRARPIANRVLGRFLHRVMSFAPVRRSIRLAVKTSAGNFNLNTQSIKGLKVPLPQIDEQVRILKGLQFIDEEILQQESGLCRVNQIQSAVSSDLLSGRVRVKDLKL